MSTPILLHDPLGAASYSLAGPHVRRNLALVILAALVLLGLTTVPASAASVPRSWWYNTARFWEDLAFNDDGVELDPGAYDLRGVTRDCAVFCWHDWNDMPESLHVAPNTWLTVWEHDRRGACVNFWGGPPIVPGSNFPGQQWDNLSQIAAGWASGNWNNRITYAQVTAVSGHEERPIVECPEAVWFRLIAESQAEK